MIWLYVLAIAVLIGAAFNAAVETVVAAPGDHRGPRAAPTAHHGRQARSGHETGEVELPLEPAAGEKRRSRGRRRDPR